MPPSAAISTALGAYADALKDDGAALYETLRSYID